MNVMLLLTALIFIIINAKAKTVGDEELNFKDIVQDFVEDDVKRELTVENAKEKQKRTLRENACPEIGVNYDARKIGEIPQVRDWETCSRYCIKYSSCKAWTWFKGDFNIPTFRFTCKLQSNVKGRKAKDGAISGRSGCTGAVDGQWGSWVAGACSKTCGRGQKTKTRRCDRPAPRNGASQCHGSDTATQACKVKSCPGTLGARCPKPSHCRKCDCGPNTGCYNWHFKAKCYCKWGFKEVDGVCKELFCTPDKFTCCGNKKCISNEKLCDGKDDCKDNPNGLGSDEKNCKVQKNTCNFMQFMCKSGKCVGEFKRCDGSNDCGQGDDSDEACCYKPSQ